MEGKDWEVVRAAGRAEVFVLGGEDEAVEKGREEVRVEGVEEEKGREEWEKVRVEGFVSEEEAVEEKWWQEIAQEKTVQRRMRGVSRAAARLPQSRLGHQHSPHSNIHTRAFCMNRLARRCGMGMLSRRGRFHSQPACHANATARSYMYRYKRPGRVPNSSPWHSQLMLSQPISFV